MIPKPPATITDTTPEFLNQLADIARDHLFAMPPVDTDWYLVDYTSSYSSRLERAYRFFRLETWDYLQDTPDSTPYRLVIEGHAEQGIDSTQIVNWSRNYLYGVAPTTRRAPQIRSLEGA